MDTLTLTLTEPRQIDGFITAANRAGMTPDALALEFLSAQGHRYADDFALGVMTSAAFIARFTPTEYAAILAVAAPVEVPVPADPENVTAEEQAAIDAATAHNTLAPQVAGLIQQLTSSPMVALDDPRLAPGLALLVASELLAPERVPELLAYERPTPNPVVEPSPEPEPEA